MNEKARGLFKRIAGAVGPAQGSPATVTWQPAGGHYPRLLRSDARVLSGRPGLYLIWHLGVRPQWLRAGFSDDLGSAAALLAADPGIAAFEVHDGPFLAWSFSYPGAAAGHVKYLAGRLNPVLQGRAFPCDIPIPAGILPIACPLPVGTKDI